MERIEDCVSFVIGKATQEIARRARGKLISYGVTPTQYAVLKILWCADGISGAQIGARLMLDSATITGLIDRLHNAGLLERRIDAADRRVHRLFLTDRGRKLQIPLDKEMDTLNREIGNLIGDDAEIMARCLRKIGRIKTSGVKNV